MKFFIATDIHGSAYWAQKVLQKFNQTRSDVLVLLGDLYNHGPRNPFPQDYSPLKVSEIFNSVSNKIIWIQGNCDSEVDTLVLQFPVEADFAYFTVAERNAIAAHGHNTPAYLNQNDLLFNGHFHVPAFENRENCTYVNCGSVSIPKEESPHSCIVIEDGVLFWKDVTTGKTFMTQSLKK